MHGNYAVCGLHVELSNQGPAAKPGGNRGNLVDGDVVKGADGRGDSVIHTLTLWRGEIGDKTPLPGGVALRDHGELAQMSEGRCISDGEWA